MNLDRPAQVANGLTREVRRIAPVPELVDVILGEDVVLDDTDHQASSSGQFRRSVFEDVPDGVVAVHPTRLLREDTGIVGVNAAPVPRPTPHGTIASSDPDAGTSPATEDEWFVAAQVDAVLRRRVRFVLRGDPTLRDAEAEGACFASVLVADLRRRQPHDGERECRREDERAADSYDTESRSEPRRPPIVRRVSLARRGDRARARLKLAIARS